MFVRLNLNYHYSKESTNSKHNSSLSISGEKIRRCTHLRVTFIPATGMRGKKQPHSLILGQKCIFQRYIPQPGAGAFQGGKRIPSSDILKMKESIPRPTLVCWPSCSVYYLNTFASEPALLRDIKCIHSARQFNYCNIEQMKLVFPSLSLLLIARHPSESLSCGALTLWLQRGDEVRHSFTKLCENIYPHLAVSAYQCYYSIIGCLLCFHKINLVASAPQNVTIKAFILSHGFFCGL